MADDEDPDFIPGEGEMKPETRQRLRRVRRAYKAMIHTVDIQVGLILDKLEKEGLLDTTVLLFTSDHGEMLGDHNRLSKMQPWRESVVVPTAIRHPDYLDGRICPAPIELTDLTATMLDVAGLNPQEALSKPWPSFHDRVPCRSLMPLVRGEVDCIRDFAFSECSSEWQMIQTPQWKYIRYLNRTPDDAVREELYDVVRDPTEQQNRANDPECASLMMEMRERRTRVMDATPPAQTRWAPYRGSTGER